MPRSNQEKPIISNTTILILSSFLIGMTVNVFASEVVSPDIAPYLLAGGFSGFIAFVALDFISAKRNQAAIQEEQDYIEHRLDQHTNSLTSVGFTMDDVSSKEMNAIDPAELMDATERNEQIVTSA